MAENQTDSGLKMVCLDDIKSLHHESVRMKDPARVVDLLNQLVDGGRSKLQVIADFDRTLTRPHYNGIECMSSYGMFNLCSTLPTSFIEQSEVLFEFYRPMENDPDMTIQEKSFHMEEWTRKKADLLHFEFDKKEIDIAVTKAHVALRAGTDVMLQSLSDSHVPVLVFSAGLGDTVHSCLRNENVMHPNVHVISNFLKFDGTRVAGMQGEIIHSFNKNESAVKNTDYFDELTGRGNVILLGDALGDAGMADGVKDLKAVLKIGFLQNRVSENLEIFMDHFDIVLIDDNTMQVVNELLDRIL